MLTHSFGIVNYVVLFGYLLAMMLVGVYFSGRQKTADDFTVTPQADKFFPATQFHWSWTESTVPVLMIGFLFANIQQFTASQDVVQRYIVTDSIEETKKKSLTNAKLIAVIPVFFFAIGSALFVYYQQHPQLLPAGLNTGGILPLFVVTKMQVGNAGLIIAAIFAAAQSSISSRLNSLSSCFNSGIYQRLSHKKRTPENRMKIAKLVILVSGLISSAASV